MTFRTIAFLLLLQSAVWAQSTSVDSLVQSTLEIAGSNRVELQTAIDSIEPEMKPGLDFLLAYMPPSDAKSLDAKFLLDHVRGAYEAWNGSPWKDKIDEDTFLDYILPYANVSERREQWRSDFRKRFLPMVESAKTPSEAAVLLNQKIFHELGVRYSTKRKRADQGPYESIEGGTASCTGLSILLIDACRSVGVPARFVGTPQWSDNSGNHSWVEIWDGEWKFTGAAEPDGDDLNKGWFTERAAKATESKREYAIYAVTYRNTGLKFPMVWRRDFDPVWSVNVTNRYAREPLIRHDQMLLRIKAIDPESGQRVVAKFSIIDETPQVLFEGETNDERFDTNDHAVAVVPKGLPIKARFSIDGVESEMDLGAPDETSLIVFQLPAQTTPNANTELSRAEAVEASKHIWTTRKNELAKSRAAEMEAELIKLDAFPNLEMKYEYKVFGGTPDDGHSLFISMHGGGGAPAKVNEQQWKNQIGLYQPAEGIYLAPRAPTNTWNLWHEAHIDQFFDRIIENFVSAGGVNPNRVYLLGYSAGGDGVYQLAPRMADRFAAASMMAGHPNGVSPEGLRNLPFAIYMGGKDAAYKRNEIAAQWKEKLAKLRKEDNDGYEHVVEIYPDKGHWMDRKDAAAIPWMLERTRNPWPTKIVWRQSGVTHDRFYWLSVAEGAAKKNTTIVATVDGQKISVETENVKSFRIWLSDKLLDLDQDIELVVNGKSETKSVNRSADALRQSLESRFDPAMMAPAYIDVSSE
jgi:predicted esterase